MPQAGRTRAEAVPLATSLAIEDAFHEAIARAGEIREELVLAGLRIELRFAGDALRTKLMPALAHARVPHGAADVRILIYDCASTRVEQPSVPWRAEDVGRRGEVAVDGLRVSVFGPSGAVSIFDAQRGLGVFCVRDAETLPSYERAAPLRTLLHWALESRGARLAHAAAVGTDRGGALLAGRGGSGKSTTALLCALAGMAYGGDDYVALTASPATAHALYASAKIDARSIALLRDLPLGCPPQEGEKGVAFLPGVSAQLPLRALLLPRVTGGRTAFRRASGAEALRALAPTTVFQLPGNDGEAFAWMASLVRTLPAFVLDLGDDRDRIPHCVSQAIEASV
jgi:hypothetical protein